MCVFQCRKGLDSDARGRQVPEKCRKYSQSSTVGSAFFPVVR